MRFQDGFARVCQITLIKTEPLRREGRGVRFATPTPAAAPSGTGCVSPRELSPTCRPRCSLSSEHLAGVGSEIRCLSPGSVAPIWIAALQRRFHSARRAQARSLLPSSFSLFRPARLWRALQCRSHRPFLRLLRAATVACCRSAGRPLSPAVAFVPEPARRSFSRLQRLQRRWVSLWFGRSSDSRLSTPRLLGFSMCYNPAASRAHHNAMERQAGPLHRSHGGMR